LSLSVFNKFAPLASQ